MSPAKKNKRRLSSLLPFLRKIIAWLAGAGIFAVIVTGLMQYLSKEPTLPEFNLVKGISYHPDSTVVLRAANGSAENEKNLSIDFEGFFYRDVIPQIGNGHTWELKLSLLSGLPDTLLKDGIREVKFGFSQNRMSAAQKLILDTQAPEAIVTVETDSSLNQRIAGQVQDQSPLKNQKISVMISLNYPAAIQTLRLPVESYTAKDGRAMYRFDYRLQNIPRISPKDPRYDKLFFSLHIKDQAGNEFVDESTYGVFTARGARRFGTKMTSILIANTTGEQVPEIDHDRIDDESRQIKDGIDLLDLRILIETPTSTKLVWTPLPDALRAVPAKTVILRDRREIGASFDNSFVDTSPTDSTTKFAVIVEAKDGSVYRSSEVTMAESQAAKQVVRVGYHYISGFDVESFAHDALQNVSTAFEEAGIEIRVIRDDKPLPFPIAGDPDSRFPDEDDNFLRQYASKHVGNRAVKHHIFSVNYAHTNGAFGTLAKIGQTLHMANGIMFSFLWWGDISENRLALIPLRTDELQAYAVATWTHELGHQIGGLTDFINGQPNGLHNPVQTNCIMTQPMDDIDSRYLITPFFCHDTDIVDSNSCRDNLLRTVSEL